MKAHRSVGLAVVGLLVAGQLVLGGVALTHGNTRAGAASAFPMTKVYVDAKAPEGGRGSAAAPYRSIQHAIHDAGANNARGVATTIVVRPGVYRESIAFEPSSRQSDAPIVLLGPSTNDAIVSGANVWTNWTPASGGTYSKSWPYQWGYAPVPSGWEDAGVTPIIRRREMLFVNGVLQRQVLSLSALQASTHGAFFVNESAHAVRVKPARGVNLNRARVEVGVRPRILLADRSRHLTIRNMRFRGAISTFAPAGQLYQVQNVLLDNVTFGWNNWTGFEAYGSTNVTVRNSTFNHNGAMGISGTRDRNLVFADDQNSYNNWRGAWGGMTLWENGMKLSLTRGTKFIRFVAVGNQGPGLWLDTDNRNVTIDRSTLKHNKVDGLFVEANQGPITVKNSLMCGNGRAGIFDGRSNNVTVVGNRVFGNGTAQLLFSGAPLSRSVTDSVTGVTTDVRSEGWTVRNNRFAGSGTKQLLVGGWGVTGSAWSTMKARLLTQNNSFTQNGAAQPFWIPGTNQPGNMGAWIAASGERGSSFSNNTSKLRCK